MSEFSLIRARWTGEVFEPVAAFRARCYERLDAGEVLTLDVLRDRSMKSHRHQFAEIRTLWETLPEHMAGLPYARSPETLRKHALIATGYCDVRTVDCGSNAAAERVAALLREDGIEKHGYAVVAVRGPVVTRYTPQSQSVRAMGGEVFRESKARVLDWINSKLQEAA